MAKIYNTVKNEPNTRLTRLNLLQIIMSFDSIRYMSYLGLTEIPPIMDNNRFGTTGELWFASVSPIMSGDGRAIDYIIRYKQLRKLYGFYISFGKSVYFHNYWIGNLKRITPICVKNYQLVREEGIESNCNHRSTISLNGIQDGEKYYGFSISIKNVYDKKEMNKGILKYKKNNIPLYLHCCYTSKFEYDANNYGNRFISGLQPVLESKPIDRVCFKPVRLPIRDIKGIITWKMKR